MPLYISEYAGGPPLGSQVPQHPPIARQVVVIGGASTASQAFNEATKMIRMHTDVVCSFRIGDAGATPTALTTDDRMAAGQTEFANVFPGAKIAVIANT
jgi:dihydrofolate reductase